jgi:Polyprenyl synthetase
MICAEYGPAVFAEIRSLLEVLDTPERENQVYNKILSRVEECANSESLFMPIDVPVSIGLVHELDKRVLCVSAAVCTMLWAGADLMDDASDGDARDDWGVSPHQLALLYTNLLASLPHMLLIGTNEPELMPGGAAFSAAIVQTLWLMSLGQMDDLDSASQVQSSDDYMRVTKLKTGAEIALFASAPGILAGLPDETIKIWREFGTHYGCMVQVFTDIKSTFDTDSRNDLQRGKRTLPVTYTLESLDSTGRSRFERDLELTALGERAAMDRVFQRMHDCQALFFSLSRMELLRYRASSALPESFDVIGQQHPFKRLLASYVVI